MPAITDLGEAIKNASSGNRVSIGPNPTFGQRTIPNLFPSIIPQIAAESLNFSSVDVATSGSATVVAAGGAKPAAATVAVTPRQIQKIAALATLNTEGYWESQDVIETVIATLLASCVSEEDKVANGVLAAAAAAPVPAADWVSAISSGQAAVATAGGAPNLAVIPASVWPVLASEIAGSAGLSTPSSDAIVSVLGSRVVLSPEGTSAFVLDPSATVRAVRDIGFLIDTASGAANNTIRIVVDLVASVFVQVPAHVVEISVTATP